MKNDQLIEKLRKRELKAVVFDFDGTILDIKKPLEKSIEEVFTEKGIASDLESSVLEIGAVLESIQGYPIPKILLQSYDIFQQITTLEKLTFLKKFRVALKIFAKYQTYSKEAELFPGIKPLLEYLNKGADLYIISHNQTNSVREHLQKEEIEKYFKGVYGADELPALKPSPDALLPVIEQYKNTSSKKFLILGDMPSDIESGQEAGVHTIGIASGISKKEILENCNPDLLFDSIIELNELLGINNGRSSDSKV
ncbi:MAG: HAD family hydrolase [Promethearchaeota archaeon]